MCDVITEEEEEALLRYLDTQPWGPASFNGQYGVQTKGRKSSYRVFSRDGEKSYVEDVDEKKGILPLPRDVDVIIERIKEVGNQLLEEATRSNHKKEQDVAMKIIDERFPNEFNANKYEKAKGDWLKPHADDRIISGDILANISMLGTSHMRFSREEKRSGAVKFDDSEYHDVFLPRRCLQLVTGAARYEV